MITLIGKDLAKEGNESCFMVLQRNAKLVGLKPHAWTL